jgi:type III secretion protein N (ATPase)
MDSLTRFARAQRQIGLAAGEPPTRRGYPPSVFEKLPTLLERGGLTNKGSITAFYTVLVEGDDMNEPVADETRSLLDGHFILSRKLAERGQFPAVDVTASTSRVMRNIVARPHFEAAMQFKMLISKYDEIELLLQMGEYETGADREGDAAVRKHAIIRDFLKQRTDEQAPFPDTVARILGLVHGG